MDCTILRMFKPFLFLIFCLAVAKSLEAPSIEKREPSTRVSNGIAASPGFFPYVAEVKLKDYDLFRCGGVIISENWILTVAYCLYNFGADDFEVRVGAVNRSDPSEAGSYEVPVDRYVLHSNWAELQVYVNNIALIHLEKPLLFSDVVQPVQMTDVSTPVDMKSPATVVGWGGPGSWVDILQFNANFELIDERFCNKFEITPNSLCTNRTAPNPTVCSYDWGGPLLQFDSAKGMVLYGVVSTAENCLSSPGEAFYENIINHRVWIYLVSGI